MCEIGSESFHVSGSLCHPLDEKGELFYIPPKYAVELVLDPVSIFNEFYQTKVYCRHPSEETDWELLNVTPVNNKVVFPMNDTEFKFVTTKNEND